MVKVFAIIGGLCLLCIGGCVALGIWGVSSAVKDFADMEIPAYATKANIDQSHGKDLDKIRFQLKERKILKYSEKEFALSEDIIGIMKEDPEDFMNDEDVYRRHDGLNKGSAMSSYGIGIATVDVMGKEINCVTYDIDYEDDEYTVLIKDHKYVQPKAVKKEPKKEGSEKALGD